MTLPSPCPDRTLERVNYFSGMVLAEADFRAEQEYFIGKARSHNRLHGSGVVCGLEVEATQPVSTSVTVSAGVALDGCGREIVLTESVTVDVSAATEAPSTVFVVIEYDEREAAHVQVPSPEGSQEQASRMRETPMLRIATTRPGGHSRHAAKPGTGVTPCPRCLDRTLVLAAIDVKEPMSITSDRIDNTQRRSLPSYRHDHSDHTDYANAVPDLVTLERRVSWLAGAVAALTVGLAASLLRH